MHITYHVNKPVDPAEVAELFSDSGLIRPVNDLPRITQMLDNADLTITAWDGAKLVGIARALTDFCYCCYLSDLAVANAYQNRGIGKELIRVTQEHVGEPTTILLLAAATAKEYYGHIGFTKNDDCWVLPRKQ